ncbi:MAG: helix-hairpin-helix domain-containing protein [Bellilinea sp.]|jgi:competence protein ComEA
MLKTIYTLALGIVIGLLAAGLILLIVSPARNAPILVLPTSTPANIWVHVAGSVQKPGLVSLPPGSRIEQAIQAAGGFNLDAQVNSLNLAARLADGQKLYIPSTSETITPEAILLDQPPQTNKIDINIATSEQLETLPGIGPSKANDIITYRQNQGRFVTIEDILKVPGIGPATLEGIRDFIVVSESP